MIEELDVDPLTLHLPSSRLGGAGPIKLTRQLSKHGLSTAGMPRLVVSPDGDGRLRILDGVTRAIRVAKWIPGQTVPVVVIEAYPKDDYSNIPTIGDRLP